MDIFPVFAVLFFISIMLNEDTDAAGLPEASFNDTRCVSGVVCPADPLIFTCNVTESDVDRALINLPSGVEVALRSDNTVAVEPNLPDGVTVQFHNVTVNNGVDYILSLAIERASLLNSSVIQCFDSSLPPVIDEASCPVATDPDPDSPQSLTQDVPANTETSLVVQWQIPSHTGGNGISIMSYNITVDDSLHDTISDDGSNLYTYNITGLRYNTNYSVAVTATNECGFTSGPATSTVNIEARVPPTPTNLMADLSCVGPLTDGRPVDISWMYGNETQGVQYRDILVMVGVNPVPNMDGCASVTYPDSECAISVTKNKTVFTVSLTLENDIGLTDPVKLTFDSEILDAKMPDASFPSVIVTINKNCNEATYSVSVGFGTQLEEETKCKPSSNSSDEEIPLGESRVFEVNNITPGSGERLCFLVYLVIDGVTIVVFDETGEIYFGPNTPQPVDLLPIILGSVFGVVAIIIVVIMIGCVVYCCYCKKKACQEKQEDGEDGEDGDRKCSIFICCMGRKTDGQELKPLSTSSDPASPVTKDPSSAETGPTYEVPNSLTRTPHPTTGEVYTDVNLDKKKNKKQENTTGAAVYQDTDVKKKNKKQENTTGAAVYQDPNTIKHEVAPSGEMYAMPQTKGKKKKKASDDDGASGKELTEEKKAALYSVPDRKGQKAKSEGLTYADIDIKASARPAPPSQGSQYVEVKHD